MPESRSAKIPRGTLRRLRREALASPHVTDAAFRAAHPHDPPWMVEAPLLRRSVVLRGDFDVATGAGFERLAHQALRGGGAS